MFLVSFYVARSLAGGHEAGWQRLRAHASVEAGLWSVRPWMAVSWQTINIQLRIFLCCMFLSMLLVCFYVAHLFLCCLFVPVLLVFVSMCLTYFYAN